MNTQSESTLMKENTDLNNVKSKYILQLIFNFLQKNKFLNVIKYNIKLQSKLNLSFNDYKDYFLYLSPIEIEIKPNSNYSNFINIPEDDEEFCHIYFDNKREETKRKYLFKGESVEKIKVILDHQITSFHNLFYNCNSAYSIKFIRFHRINIDNMNSMFYGCSSLKELDLSNFKTDNVTNMSLMFFGCSSLKKLDLSSFNTSNVEDMNNMFRECSSLEEINLSSFNFNKVKSMSYMFYDCPKLKGLHHYDFNVNNECYRDEMF